MSKKTAAGYLVLEMDEDGRVKFKRATQRPPLLQGAEIAVRLKVTLPASVFNVAVADVSVEIPEEFVAAPDVTVEPTL